MLEITAVIPGQNQHSEIQFKVNGIIGKAHFHNWGGTNATMCGFELSRQYTESEIMQIIQDLFVENSVEVEKLNKEEGYNYPANINHQ